MGEGGKGGREGRRKHGLANMAVSFTYKNNSMQNKREGCKKKKNILDANL